MRARVAAVADSTITVVVLDDEHQAVLATRILNIHVHGNPDWDEELAKLGYVRTGRWKPTVGAFECSTAPA